MYRGSHQPKPGSFTFQHFRRTGFGTSCRIAAEPEIYLGAVEFMRAHGIEVIRLVSPDCREKNE